jgi:hypothetical protein
MENTKRKREGQPLILRSLPSLQKQRQSEPYKDDLVKPEEVETVRFSFVAEAKPRYFAVYTGQQKILELSGVGKITIGREYEVPEKVANSIRRMPDWTVIER